jgi:hypothetical protein
MSPGMMIGVMGIGVIPPLIGMQKVHLSAS